LANWNPVEEYVEKSDFWNKFIYRDKLESTSGYLRKLNSLGPGVVVLTERQRKGRGKGTSRWYSPPGGLWFSFSLGGLPSNSPQKLYVEILGTLRDLLADYGVKTKISRPNDLVVDKDKIAGALIEQCGDSYIVGLGVNVNNDLSSLPEEVRKNATTLMRETGREIDRSQLLRDFLAQFENWWAN